MNAPHWLITACFLGILAGCGPQSSPAPAVTDSFGNSGKTSSTFEGKLSAYSMTRWQHGAQLTYCVIGQLPDQDPGPAALLLIRLPSPDAPVTRTGSSQSPEGKIVWSQQLTSAGKTFEVVYEITPQPVGEAVILGGQPFDLDSGRFFLIDLTQYPVKPVQVKDKIVPLLPSHDPTEEDLKAAVAKLKDRNEAVRKFLDNGR